MALWGGFLADFGAVFRAKTILLNCPLPAAVRPGRRGRPLSAGRRVRHRGRPHALFLPLRVLVDARGGDTGIIRIRGRH